MLLSNLVCYHCIIYVMEKEIAWSKCYSIIDAWEPLLSDLQTPLKSQSTSQTSVTSSKAGTKGPPLFGKANMRVLPLAAPHNEEADDATSSPNASQATSQTSLGSSRNLKGPPLFGRARVRVSPALNTEEADDATNSTVSGRHTPDVFINDGVAVEKATGEKSVEVQEDSSTVNAATAPIEVPHCVDHQPYIPLQSAQDALAKVRGHSSYDIQNSKHEIPINPTTGGE